MNRSLSRVFMRIVPASPEIRTFLALAAIAILAWLPTSIPLAIILTIPVLLWLVLFAWCMFVFGRLDRHDV